MARDHEPTVDRRLIAHLPVLDSSDLERECRTAERAEVYHFVVYGPTYLEMLYVFGVDSKNGDLLYMKEFADSNPFNHRLGSYFNHHPKNGELKAEAKGFKRMPLTNVASYKKLH